MGSPYGAASAHAVGQDLLAWLDDRERNAAAPLLSNGLGPFATAPTPELPGAASDTAMTTHQETAEVEAGNSLQCSQTEHRAYQGCMVHSTA